MALAAALMLATAVSGEHPGLRVTLADGSTRQLDPWGEDSIRVRMVPPGGKIGQPAAQALLPTAPPPSPGVVQSDASSLINGNLRVDLSPEGLATFTRVSDGRVLLEEQEVTLSPPRAPGAATAAPAAGATRGGNCSSMLVDTDFNGGDLPGGHDRSTASAADCCTACFGHPACNFWTFVADSSNARGCWMKSRMETVLKQQPNHTAGIARPPAPAPPVAKVSTGSVRFAGLEPGEGLYGFGEHRGSSRCDNQCVGTTLPIKAWDWSIQHSQDVHFLPNNGNAWIPFYTSSKGYGFLWNLASYGLVHVGPDAVRWSTNATSQLDYFVTTTSAAATAPSIPPFADLMRHYAAATGPPPALPNEYTGFWQCKLRYSSQEQITRIAQGYIDRNLPISVIVIDFHHWVHEGDWRFSDDPAVPGHTTGCWPDPAAMVANLTSLGIKCAVSVWPDVQTDAINYANMSSHGMLIRGVDGQPAGSVQGKDYVDAFNPATRQYMFQQLVDGYGRYGIDTYWLDATEPQGANIGNWYYRLDDGTTHADLEVGMAWVQQYHRMLREGLVAREPAATALPPFLTRSAFAGSQRYGAILWSGDIESSFNELATQVQVAQHVAMSGIYLWTTDIGGFRNGDTEDPMFRELIVRWFQFGAFCPIFRLHGNRGGPKDVDVCGATGHNEVWSFGNEAYAAIAGVMRMRERLRPYVQKNLELASSQGTPILRPMAFDFPDEDCVDAVDQYMFGPTYLVAPVLYYKATNRSVYLPRLPPAEKWVNVYTAERDGDAYAAAAAVGPGWVTVSTVNVSEFPLFMRLALPMPQS